MRGTYDGSPCSDHSLHIGFDLDVTIWHVFGGSVGYGVRVCAMDDVAVRCIIDSGSIDGGAGLSDFCRR